MRRAIILGTLGAVLSVTGAQAGSKCSDQRQALREASSGLRSDVSQLGRIHSAEVRVERSIAHYGNVAYHLDSAIDTHQHEARKAQAFLDARCGAEHTASAQSCENHRDRVAWIEDQITRLGEAEDQALGSSIAKQGDLASLQAQEAAERAQISVDQQAVSDAKDALSSCLAG